MKRAVSWSCVLISGAMLIAFAGAARAEAPAPEPAAPTTDAMFREGTAALKDGRVSDALTTFEALGDRGVTDPVVSFDRGLAYALRVREESARPGDLGRAVHGFEEARELTRDPRLRASAEHALTDVRAEIARRHAREGTTIELDDTASLGRSLVHLLPENAWAILALVGSLALSLAIVLRAKAGSARQKVARTTAGAIFALVFVASAVATFAARSERRTLREGIVIADTRLLDERHVVKNDARPLSEGARVRLLDDGGEFTKVKTSAGEGYVSSSSVLPLARP